MATSHDAFPFASGTGLPKALEPRNSCTDPAGVPLPPLTVACRYMPIPSIVPPTVGYGELRTTRVVVDAACALTAARECAGTTSSVSVAIAVASATATSRAPIRVSRDIYASVPTVLLEAVDACSGGGGRTFDRFERGGGDTGRVEAQAREDGVGLGVRDVRERRAQRDHR